MFCISSTVHEKLKLQKIVGNRTFCIIYHLNMRVGAMYSFPLKKISFAIQIQNGNNMTEAKWKAIALATFNIRVQELNVTIAKRHCLLRQSRGNFTRKLKVHKLFVLPCCKPSKFPVVAIICEPHLWPYHDNFSVQT